MSVHLSICLSFQLCNFPHGLFFFLDFTRLDLCLSHDNLWSLSIGQEVNSTCPTSSLDRNMFSLHAYLVFTCNCRSFEYVFITKPEKFSEKVFSICSFFLALIIVKVVYHTEWLSLSFANIYDNIQFFFLLIIKQTCFLSNIYDDIQFFFSWWRKHRHIFKVMYNMH